MTEPGRPLCRKSWGATTVKASLVRAPTALLWKVGPREEGALQLIAICVFFIMRWSDSQTHNTFMCAFQFEDFQFCHMTTAWILYMYLTSSNYILQKDGICHCAYQYVKTLNNTTLMILKGRKCSMYASSICHFWYKPSLLSWSPTARSAGTGMCTKGNKPLLVKVQA